MIAQIARLIAQEEVDQGHFGNNRNLEEFGDIKKNHGYSRVFTFFLLETFSLMGKQCRNHILGFNTLLSLTKKVCMCFLFL